MSKEVSEKTLERVDKQFLTPFNEESQSTVLAYNTFVRSSAHTAITQIYNDALAFDPKVASLLASRVINFVYQWHHELTLGPKEEEMVLDVENKQE